jgi:2-succinyl-5-enolpyruvyl-6-hydroxy-3-cyclohexene-1-carboxylate synthase
LFRGYHYNNFSGSRNAPLTIGFVSNPALATVLLMNVLLFFAMGIAQQTKQPAVLVCTSGSALLNYYPAIAEAFYSQIPLIVISADRPQSKIDIGDGQTIRQENVFANHSLYNANLNEVVSVENDTKINEAISISIGQGPVHINAPLKSPCMKRFLNFVPVTVIASKSVALTFRR